MCLPNMLSITVAYWGEPKCHCRLGGRKKIISWDEKYTCSTDIDIVQGFFFWSFLMSNHYSMWVTVKFAHKFRWNNRFFVNNHTIFRRFVNETFIKHSLFRSVHLSMDFIWIYSTIIEILAVVQRIVGIFLQIKRHLSV